MCNPVKRLGAAVAIFLTREAKNVCPLSPRCADEGLASLQTFNQAVNVSRLNAHKASPLILSHFGSAVFFFLYGGRRGREGACFLALPLLKVHCGANTNTIFNFFLFWPTFTCTFLICVHRIHDYCDGAVGLKSSMGEHFNKNTSNGNHFSPCVNRTTPDLCVCFAVNLSLDLFVYGSLRVNQQNQSGNMTFACVLA